MVSKTYDVSKNKQFLGVYCIVKAITEHLDLALNDRDINSAHRLGSLRNACRKPRPITFKFVRCNNRKKFLAIRKG